MVVYHPRAILCIYLWRHFSPSMGFYFREIVALQTHEQLPPPSSRLLAYLPLSGRWGRLRYADELLEWRPAYLRAAVYFCVHSSGGVHLQDNEDDFSNFEICLGFFVSFLQLSGHHFHRKFFLAPFLKLLCFLMNVSLL